MLVYRPESAEVKEWRKFKDTFIGPFVIKKIISEHNYLVDHVQKETQLVVHFDHLVRFLRTIQEESQSGEKDKNLSIRLQKKSPESQGEDEVTVIEEKEDCSHMDGSEGTALESHCNNYREYENVELNPGIPPTNHQQDLEEDQGKNAEETIEQDFEEDQGKNVEEAIEQDLEEDQGKNAEEAIEQDLEEDQGKNAEEAIEQSPEEDREEDLEEEQEENEEEVQEVEQAENIETEEENPQNEEGEQPDSTDSSEEESVLRRSSRSGKRPERFVDEHYKYYGPK